MIHCLFNCNWVKAIWNSVVDPSCNLINEDNLIFTWSHDNIEKLGIVIPITTWLIWCARNTKILYDSNTFPIDLLSKINYMTRDVAHAFSVTYEDSTTHQAQFIAWQRGPSDTYILNLNGSAQSNLGMTGFGGLIRDSNGGYMHGFYVILVT